ncbi:MAG TPA: Hpt domain-containing protein [Solirubrobacteraceae bacterium]|jgi:chemotaxis protein histidine kinase CheA|nr:Hpt domain-containing protein [Solirubrobacteraceae bacterium]
MPATIDAKAAESASVREGALRVVWDEHLPEALTRVSLIERAITALASAELDEQLRREAQKSAHMLSGSLGVFGFASASDAAHALELELVTPARERAPGLSTLVAIVRRGFGARVSAAGAAQTIAH